MPKTKMRAQWVVFANKYVETSNIYESAIHAGYAESYARGRAYQLLEKQCIKDYIQERIDEQEAQGIADLDEILKFYSKVMRGEVKDQMGFESSVRDRVNAAKELEKRYPVPKEEANKMPPVTIINNMPDPDNKKQDTDE